MIRNNFWICWIKTKKKWFVMQDWLKSTLGILTGCASQVSYSWNTVREPAEDRPPGCCCLQDCREQWWPELLSEEREELARSRTHSCLEPSEQNMFIFNSTSVLLHSWDINSSIAKPRDRWSIWFLYYVNTFYIVCEDHLHSVLLLH